MLMNNTKWRECMNILASHSVYLQMRLVGETNFPLDHEVSNQAISHIGAKDCIFVRRVIAYKSIAGIRIVKTHLPPSATTISGELFAEIKAQLSGVGQLSLAEDPEFLTLYGYSL